MTPYTRNTDTTAGKSRLSPLTPVPSGDISASGGDGFTQAEIHDALRLPTPPPWQPNTEYSACEIRGLRQGTRAVTFSGRVANIYDVVRSSRTLPRAFRGCLKLRVKDDGGLVVVHCWFAARKPVVRLGSLVSVWTKHSRSCGDGPSDGSSTDGSTVGGGNRGELIRTNATLSAFVFPERDRDCHLSVHECDDGTAYRLPPRYIEGVPLSGLMTLKSFIDGGYEFAGARVLVAVRSVGEVRVVTRKDNSKVNSINVQIQDDTAKATLGLWGTSALSPGGLNPGPSTSANAGAGFSKDSWRADETILLLQSPSCKPGPSPYLTLTSVTTIDINPAIPDAATLRHWIRRHSARQAINPPFPTTTNGPFDPHILSSSPIRCLYTLADLDEAARHSLAVADATAPCLDARSTTPTTMTVAPPNLICGFLSVLLISTHFHNCARRGVLFAGECCCVAMYANDASGAAVRESDDVEIDGRGKGAAPGGFAVCTVCDRRPTGPLRLNPRLIGPVLDETGMVGGGRQVLSDGAWADLLRLRVGGDGERCDEPPGDVLRRMTREAMRALDARLRLRRVTLLFAWTGEEAVAAAGRICVTGVRG